MKKSFIHWCCLVVERWPILLTDPFHLAKPSRLCAPSLFVPEYIPDKKKREEKLKHITRTHSPASVQIIFCSTVIRGTLLRAESRLQLLLHFKIGMCDAKVILLQLSIPLILPSKLHSFYCKIRKSLFNLTGTARSRLNLLLFVWIKSDLIIFSRNIKVLFNYRFLSNLNNLYNCLNYFEEVLKSHH